VKISIIVPFYNEEECVVDVLDEVRAACPDAEIIAVNDGSKDKTPELLDELGYVRAIHFPHNLGQSAALYHGLHAATGDYCVMMDGDGQNDPADIAACLEQADPGRLVCGVRQNRQDSAYRKLASRIANRIRRIFLKDGASDTGCSLKVLHRSQVCHMVPFNGLHRFMPALMKNAGLEIHEIPVHHRPRVKGTSKYTVGGRAIRGIRDLFGVAWLLSRQIHWEKDPYPHV
jgi:dolichol-phosphate mannosyltransferase